MVYPLSKGSTSSLIQRPGIDDRLGVLAGAEHDKQVGDHGRLALFVEVDHIGLVELVESHFDHADGAVDDHLTGIDDRAGLLSLEHDRGDLRRVSQMGDAGVDDLEAGRFDLRLDLIFDALCHEFGGTAQGTVIRFAVAGGVDVGRDVIRIDLRDAPDGRVGLERQVLFVVVDVEDRLRGVDDTPHDGDADLDRVAERVIDLLLRVGQGHDLQGDLPGRSHLGVEFRRRLFPGVAFGQGAEDSAASGDVAGLAELGELRGVDGRAERVHEIEPLALQRTFVLTEQRQDQRFLGLQDLEAGDADGQDDPEQDAEGTERCIHPSDEADEDHTRRGDEPEDDDEQHGHAELFGGIDFFCHGKHLFDSLCLFACSQSVASIDFLIFR